MNKEVTYKCENSVLSILITVGKTSKRIEFRGVTGVRGSEYTTSDQEIMKGIESRKDFGTKIKKIGSYAESNIKGTPTKQPTNE